MIEKEKKSKRDKPKISKLAIASPLLIVLSYLGLGLASELELINIHNIGGYLLLLLAFVGLVVGIAAIVIIIKRKGRLWGAVFAVAGIVLAVFLIVYLFLPPPTYTREIYYKIGCAQNISTLGKAIKVYSSGNEGKYPTADKWCDLLVKYSYAGDYSNMFMCKGALESGDKGRCSYAMNPNCGPDSPNDVVLLFETKGGWNQFGGKELLTTENHKGDGCNVLFNDGDVKFVKPERLGELKWDVEEAK